jgi:hypothetical protein
MAHVYQIPVTKAGKRPMEFNTDDPAVTDEIFAIIVFEGLKHFINLGTSKIKQEDYKTLEDFEAAAWAIAEKQKEKILAGEIKKRTTATKTKGAGVEMTEALRLAKLSAKEQYKVLAATDKSLPRMSHVTPKLWTDAAKAKVNSDPDAWLAAARQSLARAHDVPKADAADIFAHFTADPKKVEASKAKAKKAKPQAPVVPAKGKGMGKPQPQA